MNNNTQIVWLDKSIFLQLSFYNESHSEESGEYYLNKFTLHVNNIIYLMNVLSKGIFLFIYFNLCAQHVPSTDLSTLYLRFFNTNFYTTSLSQTIKLLLYKYTKYLWAYGKIVYLRNRYIGKMQKGKNISVYPWADLHM